MPAVDPSHLLRDPSDAFPGRAWCTRSSRRSNQAPGSRRLYREHGERLWRSIFLFAGDREVASDAVIEAFAQAIARGDAIRSPLEWVTKAAFRIAAGELAGRRRSPIVLGQIVDEVACDPDEPGFPLREQLMRLSPKQRAAVILFDVEGYSSSSASTRRRTPSSRVGRSRPTSWAPRATGYGSRAPTADR
jgi:DNA-directed RNA polymerase specialized sigma24 family protein